MAESVEPTYMIRLASPGAMPSACVMSSVCSVSSQLPPAVESTQLVLVPSVESERDGNVVGLVGILVVGGQIGEIGAVILQQADDWPLPVSDPP